jgi:AcrR family transcriptional regulator
MASLKPHDRILEAATRLFYQEGIQVTGVNRIIAEADVAPMTLYRRFGGKDTLVAASLEQWSADWLSWLNEAVERRGGEDPQARLAALWDVLEEWLASEGFRGCFVTNAATELRSKPAHPAHGVVAAHRMAVRQLLEDLAKLAGARDPVALAAQLLVIIDGMVALAVDNRRSPVPDAARSLARAALTASVAAHS